MKVNGMIPVSRATCAVTAAMLALVLVACERQPAKPAATPVPTPAPIAPPPEVKAVPQKPEESPQVVADRALAAKVKEALLAEPKVKAHGIDVVAKDGVVTLFGTADTTARRQLAGKIAAAVAGVKSVENKLAVVAGS